jgi:hypothetical protein
VAYKPTTETIAQKLGYEELIIGIKKNGNSSETDEMIVLIDTLTDEINELKKNVEVLKAQQCQIQKLCQNDTVKANLEHLGG